MAMNQNTKIALIIILSLGAITGIVFITRGAVKNNKRKQSCLDKGLEGEDLKTCMDDMKASEKNKSQQEVLIEPTLPVVGEYQGYEPIVGNGATQLSNMMNAGSNGASSGTTVFPLKYGSRGDKVKAIQKAYNNTYPTDRISVDGHWGSATQSRAKKLLAKVGVTKVEVTEAIYNKYFKRYE